MYITNPTNLRDLPLKNLTGGIWWLDIKSNRRRMAAGHLFNSITSYCHSEINWNYLFLLDCILINKCSINNPCVAPNSQCIFDGPGIYHCECKHGYAGNGTICGEDTDLDGIPDNSLGCTSRLCLKDNCMETPNYRQQKTNSSTAEGDACVDDDDNDGIKDKDDFCPKVSLQYL